MDRQKPRTFMCYKINYFISLFFHFTGIVPCSLIFTSVHVHQRMQNLVPSDSMQNKSAKLSVEVDNVRRKIFPSEIVYAQSRQGKKKHIEKKTKPPQLTN